MCGIAAIMLKRGPGEVGAAMCRMLVSLQHRGPDSTGYALYGSRGGGAGKYVIWVKLEDPEAFGAERTRALGVQTDEMLETIAGLGGRVIKQEAFLDYALRLVVEYAGEVKTFVQAVEGTGVEITSLGRSMELVKDVGLAADVADRYQLTQFHGTHGLGHVRMATESAVDVSHAHPFWAYPYPDICVVHNGQITNYWKSRRLLELRGERFRSRCDSELIAVYLAVKLRQGASLEEAMHRSLTELDGVFTYFVATEHEIGVAKDSLAAKPLVVMEDDHAVALASEEVALRAVFPAKIDSHDPYEGKVFVWHKRTVGAGAGAGAREEVEV